jgi:hypothetical protein
MQESELRQTPARAQVQAAPVAVTAVVGIDVACQPRSTVGNDAFCRPRNDSPSAARLGRSMVVQAVDADQAPLSKKPKTSSLPLGTPSPGQNTVVPASSSLAVDFQLPRSQTLESTALSNVAASSDGLGGLLQRIQDEIRRLESLGQADLYDTQLLQMLVKFHAELLLVHIQKMHSSVSSSKRARGEDSWGTEASRLLREKLQKEIALLNIQADREKLELEHDQIRHQAATMLCRNQLLGKAPHSQFCAPSPGVTIKCSFDAPDRRFRPPSRALHPQLLHFLRSRLALPVQNAALVVQQVEVILCLPHQMMFNTHFNPQSKVPFWREAA